MPRRIFNIFLLLPLFSFGQYDTAQFPIPMKNRIIFYENTYNAGRIANKKDIKLKLEKWFADTSADLKKKINSINPVNGEISGNVVFKVNTNDNGNYYWMRAVLTITPTDSGYSFQSFNYYEKPIVKGITNDWSKIEYRWYDFRRGKPWSADDNRLFKGIHEGSLALIETLEKQVGK